MTFPKFLRTFSAATLYFCKSIIGLLLLKKNYFLYFFQGYILFYIFFLAKMVNLVIEDSSDFTFRDLNQVPKCNVINDEFERVNCGKKGHLL